MTIMLCNVCCWTIPDHGIMLCLRQVFPRRSCLSVRWFAALETLSHSQKITVTESHPSVNWTPSNVTLLVFVDAKLILGCCCKSPVQISAVGVNKSTATYSQLLPQTFSQLVAVQISVHMSLVWSGSMVNLVDGAVSWMWRRPIRHILQLVCTCFVPGVSLSSHSSLVFLVFLVVKLEVQFGEGEVWSQVMQNPIWR